MVTGPEVESSTQLSKSNTKEELTIIDPVTDGFPCNIRIEESWEFRKYEPKSGKALGIWPDPGGTQALWSDYRIKWGFSQIIVQGAGVQIAQNAGFSTDNLMFGLSGSVAQVQTYVLNNNVKYFYIDEPIERGTYTESQLINIANFISTNKPNSFFYMGTWQYNPYLGPRYEYLNVLYATSNSYVQCDQYDGDQRNLWTGFKSYAGSRNPSNWIHSRRDPASEYSNLLGHANNIGLNSLWYFIGEDGNASNIDPFCWDAWKKGFLRRYEQKVIRYYKCIQNNCEICSEGGTWVLYNTLYGEVKEVF